MKRFALWGLSMVGSLFLVAYSSMFLAAWLLGIDLQSFAVIIFAAHPPLVQFNYLLTGLVAGAFMGATFPIVLRWANRRFYPEADSDAIPPIIGDRPE